MHIVQITTGRDINGAVRHCYDLSLELASQGHRVTLLCRPDSWIGNQSIPASIDRLICPLKRNRKCLKETAHYLKEIGAEVLHTHMSGASFFGVLLARLYGFRSVATCHMPHIQPHWWWNDRVIVPCKSVARFQRWINLVPSGRIDIVPNFINPNRLLDDSSPAQIRRELNIPVNAFVIGVVGTLQQRKGFQYLLPVIEKLNSNSPPVHLISIGPHDPAYANVILPQIERTLGRSRIHILGQRNDIPRLLRSLNCVCLPSNKEVMPISLLEAMATGLPAIATNVGGIPDCIRDKIDGFIVPPRNSNAIENAVRIWLEEPELCSRMGYSARDGMLQRFTSGAILPNIVRSYTLAMGSNRLRHQ